MARFTQIALAACLLLALSSHVADAFTVPSSSSITHHTHQRRRHHHPLHLSSTAEDSKPPTLKRLPESAVELTLHIPAKATGAAYDKTLAEVSKNVSIPGFRKGAKIPPQVIENAWSKQGGKRALVTMAINEMCGELIAPALKDEYELEPIGQPTLVTPAEQLAEGFTPGEELEVTVKCDVWPEIKWKEVEGQEKPYLGLKGKYKRKPFNQERFDAALRDLTERYVKLEPYEDESKALEQGDACKVDMVGYMATPDGEKGEKLPEAASGDNVEVVLGPGRYMEGLVEGLEGGKVGETKTVNVRFPAVSSSVHLYLVFVLICLLDFEAYLMHSLLCLLQKLPHSPHHAKQKALKNKDLAGKDAIFDVSILSASKRILPEITDEFANEVRPGLTAESLKDELRKAVDSQDAQEYMGVRNEALGKALSEIMDVDVPDTLVTNQAREKYAMMMTDMRNSGMADEEIKKLISPENFVKYKDIEKPDIVKDFKVSMAVDEIARLENIQVPAYQIEEQIQSLKDQATKEGTATDDMDDEQMRRKVESTLERRMVYDFLAEAADLEVEYIEEEEGFDEALMEKLAAESLAREQEKEDNEGEGKQQDEVVAPAAEAAAVEKEVQPKKDVSSASAKSKEEDLDLTTQVIMNHLQDDDDGVVDDDDE